MKHHHDRTNLITGDFTGSASPDPNPRLRRDVSNSLKYLASRPPIFTYCLHGKPTSAVRWQRRCHPKQSTESSLSLLTHHSLSHLLELSSFLLTSSKQLESQSTSTRRLRAQRWTGSEDALCDFALGTISHLQRKRKDPRSRASRSRSIAKAGRGECCGMRNGPCTNHSTNIRATREYSPSMSSSCI